MGRNAARMFGRDVVTGALRFGLARSWALGLLVASPTQAQVPNMVDQPRAKASLELDGRPFLVLGVQLNNSSGFPSEMRRLAPAISRSHANVVMAPIGWQSVEPEEGRFDWTA